MSAVVASAPPTAAASTSGASAAAAASAPAADGDVKMGDANGDDTAAAEQEQLPQDASEVVYVNNLNERIKVDGQSGRV